MSDKAFAKLFHDLPLAALGLDEKTVADMARAGLRRIGDVALRPRAPITARFGALPVARLDALKGLDARFDLAALSPARFLRRAAVRLAHSDGRGDRGLLAQARRRPRRAARAAGEGGAAGRAFALPGRRRRAPHRGRRLAAAERSARDSCACSPRSSRARDEDAIDAGFGVDLMRLACLAAEPLAPSQSEIERAHEAERARALADLIDRLSARLGARAVTRRDLVEAHLPELAESPPAPATCERGASGAESRHREARRSRGRARRRGPCASSSAPSRSRRWRKSPTGRRCASAGGACCTTSPPSKAPSASRRRGGGATAARPATISAPRISRPPLLALPRRPLGPRDRPREMVRARGVRVIPFCPLAGEGGGSAG